MQISKRKCTKREDCPSHKTFYQRLQENIMITKKVAYYLRIIEINVERSLTAMCKN